MPLPPRTSPTRHRIQFAAAVLATVGAVYGFSRLIKPHSCSARPTTKPITYVPAPPILPRVDPPLDQPGPLPPRVSPAFLAAVAEDDVPEMEKLFTKGMALDGALHIAASRGNRTIVAWLLDHGADVHEDEAEVEAPLLVADARPNIVKLLLDRGVAEPELAVAAIAGAPNAVGRLIAKQAPVNPKNGSTPLYDAVNSTLATPQNRRLVVEKLLAAGADPNSGEEGSTPLSAAISRCEAAEDATPTQKAAPPSCVALIHLLGGRGARVTSAALQSVMAMEEPTRAPVLDALLAGHLEADATTVAIAQATGEHDAASIRKIAARGVAWSWHDGETDASAPLLDAIDRSDVPLVRVMLEVGAPADMHFKDGRSPLGLALDKGAGDADAARIVELLVARGAGVNRRLPDGRTPLFAAAESGEIRVINALLEHGARVNEVILDETALDAAERSGHVPAARILHARGGRRAPSKE